MPAKTNDKKLPKFKIFAEIDNTVRDHEKDPYFVKKAEEAKKFLEKHGLPEKLRPKK